MGGYCLVSLVVYKNNILENSQLNFVESCCEHSALTGAESDMEMLVYCSRMNNSFFVYLVISLVVLMILNEENNNNH